VQILDGILDRDDVGLPRLVDVVDDRGEGRRLTGAGGPREKDQPALLVGDLGDHGRKAKLLDRFHAIRDHAHDDRDGSPLPEGVDTEAGETGDRVREVDLVVLLELGHLVRVLGEHLPDHALGVLLAKDLPLFQLAQAAVDAGKRERLHLEVKIRPVVLNDPSKRLLELEHPDPHRRGTEQP
jgi:hypothetical protein